MDMTRIGSLFSGAGGLDRAVEQVFGGHTVWHCEVDPAASKVLAHRWPGVPNLGDITAVDWTQVEPVDILCGGWPCQPFSLAGKRKGADDERALWPYVARAVRMVRPRIVVLENVSAVLGPEFQRVANDLAALGYDIGWTCLRASDVGAPHRRERLFALATDTRGSAVRESARGASTEEAGTATGDRLGDCGGERPTRNGWPTADSSCDGRHEGWPESAGFVGGPDAPVGGDGPVELLPTPRGAAQRSSRKAMVDNQQWSAPSLEQAIEIAQGILPREFHSWDEVPGKSALLPTPRASRGASTTETSYALGGERSDDDRTQGEVLLPTPRTSDTNGAGVHGTGGMDLRTTVSLLPTPTTCDHKPTDSKSDHERHSPGLGAVTFHTSQWGKYEPAIRRWENRTRPAPAPTEPNKNGNPRLAAAFSEWMMGWPAGWVTDVPGISRNDQLRIIGNGVCVQQCVAALRYLLSIAEAA